VNTRTQKEKEIGENEKGSSMLELIVGLTFISVVGLTIVWSAISGVRYQKQTEVGNTAMNLAISRAEELAGIFIESLDASFNENDIIIQEHEHNIELLRKTLVTINPDGSRTVTVTISGPDRFLPIPVEYTTTFALWES
jgi:hypothetical protein